MMAMAPGMISCAELVERLGSMLEGGLDAATMATIERHLGKCHPCSRIARSYNEVVEASQQVDPVPLDQDLSEQIVSEVLARIGGQPPYSGDDLAPKD